MRPRLLLVAPCFVILCILRPQTRNGFADIPWGTAFDIIKERFELVPSAAGKSQSQYLSNVVMVGKAETNPCEFEFSNRRFSGVIVTTRGERNSHALLAYLKGLYGDGLPENPLACQWFAGSTHASYDEDSEGNAYVYIYSLSFQSREERLPHQ
jgi:hypothetical protein